jgi:hypothetical protein
MKLTLLLSLNPLLITYGGVIQGVLFLQLQPICSRRLGGSIIASSASIMYRTIIMLFTQVNLP